MNYSEILPELLVGACPASAEEVQQLKQLSGVTAALSLQTDADLHWLGLDWPELQGWYSAVGIQARRVPVRDGDTQDLRARLPACARALDALLAQGHKVYLHCTAGVGRSPTVAIAWLVWRGRMQLEEARAWVTQRRSCSPDMNALDAVLEENPFCQDLGGDLSAWSDPG